MRHTKLAAVVATMGLLVILGCDSDEKLTCACEPTVPAIITTFADENAFVQSVAPGAPLDAPFDGLTDSVVVGEGLFVIRAGGGVVRIAVSNVVNNSLPTDLMVACECYSNLEFQFARPISGFGFAIDSWSRTDSLGASDFVVVLYDGTTAVGSAQFSAPAFGESFFALLSSAKFDKLTLQETRGGPQEGPMGTGGVDREFFGKFYVVQ